MKSNFYLPSIPTSATLLERCSTNSSYRFWPGSLIRAHLRSRILISLILRANHAGSVSTAGIIIVCLMMFIAALGAGRVSLLLSD